MRCRASLCPLAGGGRSRCGPAVPKPSIRFVTDSTAALGASRESAAARRRNEQIRANVSRTHMRARHGALVGARRSPHRDIARSGHRRCGSCIPGRARGRRCCRIAGERPSHDGHRRRPLATLGALPGQPFALGFVVAVEPPSCARPTLGGIRARFGRGQRVHCRPDGCARLRRRNGTACHRAARGRQWPPAAACGGSRHGTRVPLRLSVDCLFSLGLPSLNKRLSISVVVFHIFCR